MAAGGGWATVNLRALTATGGSSKVTTATTNISSSSSSSSITSSSSSSSSSSSRSGGSAITTVPTTVDPYSRPPFLYVAAHAHIAFPLVREGTLPEQVEIRLCANGVQLLHVCGGEGEPRILRAWNWEDVAFWRLREQPPLETDSQEELMDLLMIGSRTPDPAEVAKASLNGGSGAIPAVMTFEVEHGAVVRRSFEACCPWTRDGRLSAARAATAAACIAGLGDEALWKATPLREPCCVVYPVNQPSAATTAPGTQPLPQLVLLRIGGEGIQLTSAGSAPRALCAWAWADLAFWHFEVQHTDSEHHDDSMDLLVIGTYPFRPAEFPQSASSARTLSILKMETEEIDEIRIALEMFCPQVPEPLPLIAAYDHMANGLELSCFEVFPIAEIDQRGGSSPAFHNLPERVRL